jgi:hypothetical protein
MKEIATWIGYFVMIMAPFLIGAALYDFSDRLDTCKTRIDFANDRIDIVLKIVEDVSSRVDKLEEPKDASN